MVVLKNDYDDCYIIHLEYGYKYNNKDYYYTNTYWINKKMDEIDLSKKTFYNIGIKNYTDFSSLQKLPKTDLDVEIIDKKEVKEGRKPKTQYELKITNKGQAIALLLEIQLFKNNGKSSEIITPVFYNDNYFSLKKGSSYNVIVQYYTADIKDEKIVLDIIGWNIAYNKTLN